MTGRIITVRHGRPALSRAVLISGREYGEWWAQYDKSGLYPGQTPPESLREIASHSTTILSSTMPRAIETAQLLAREGGQSDQYPPNELFIEAALPAPPWPAWFKLSPKYWGAISRFLWLRGYTPEGMETRQETHKRVDKIIDQLLHYAEKGDVILCAHGYINWMIGQRLRKRGKDATCSGFGWKCTDRYGGHRYWNWRLYECKAAPSS